MKFLENYFADRKLTEIKFAMQTMKIKDLAKAADVSLSDPMFAELPIEEAFQVLLVRINDRVKRILELKLK